MARRCFLVVAAFCVLNMCVQTVIAFTPNGASRTCFSSPTRGPALPSARRMRAGGKVSMMPQSSPQVPYKERDMQNYIFVDIFQRMFRERVLFVNRELSPELVNQMIATLLYLESEDATAGVSMYFNCPGGAVKDGLALADCMQKVKFPITCLNMGLAAQMGAILVASGTPGLRYALPNSRFQISAPRLDYRMEQRQMQAEDILIECKELLREKEQMEKILSRITGQSTDRIARDIKRDFYLTSFEAQEYGMVDKVLVPAPKAVRTARGPSSADGLGQTEDPIGFGIFAGEDVQKYDGMEWGKPSPSTDSTPSPDSTPNPPDPPGAPETE